MPFAPAVLLASEVITAVRGRTRIGLNPPNAALQSAELWRVLNSVNEWFVYWCLDKEGVQPLKRFRKHQLVKTKANTALAAAVASGANSLTLDSGTDFGSPTVASPLAAVIKNSDAAYQFFTYESRATITLSELATLSTDFEDGDEVHKLYELNDDYGQPRTLSANNQRPYIYLDGEFETMPPSGCFHIKLLESKTGLLRPFIVLPESISTGITFTFVYIKRPKDIVDGTSTLDARAGLEREAILEKMAEYVWNVRGEDGLENAAKAKADEIMSMIHSKEAQYDASADQGPRFDMSIGI